MTEERLRGSVVTVTPSLAEKWLSESNTHNRAIRNSAVDRYAADMSAGRWRLTHEAIAFTNPQPDGKPVLIDGQHRLWAIVQSGASIDLYVVRGEDIEAQQYINEGVPRNAVDVLKLANPDSNVNTYTMATARRMLIGTRTQVVLTRHEQIEFYSKHSKAIQFAVQEVLQNKKIWRVTPASVAAVIARASYHEPNVRLLEFGNVLITGLVSNPVNDIAAIRLREWLLTGSPDRGARVGRELLIYGKTQRALLGFMRGENMRSIYIERDELWTVPGEQRRISTKTRTLGKRSTKS